MGTRFSVKRFSPINISHLPNGGLPHADAASDISGEYLARVSSHDSQSGFHMGKVRIIKHNVAATFDFRQSSLESQRTVRYRRCRIDESQVEDLIPKSLKSTVSRLARPQREVEHRRIAATPAQSFRPNARRVQL